MEPIDPGTASGQSGDLANVGDTELIFRAASAFDRMTAQMRRAMAINAHERLAIALLWDKGPLTMSDLGTGIPLSRAAVTTLVDRLEEAGYVARGSDRNDRRRTVVTLTRKGEREIEPLLEPWGLRVAALRERLGEDAWASVRAYLLELRSFTSEYADQLSKLSDTELRRVATTSGGAA